MAKQADTTTEAFRNLGPMMEPWIKAIKAYHTETEKFQKSLVEGMNKALDNSHKVAKESMEMANSMSNTVHKQMTAQVERSCDWMTSMLP